MFDDAVIETDAESVRGYISDGKKRPVMVWLHGGGFSMGSANDASNDGTALSKSGDVVVVGVNHRLNTYGYLDLSAYVEKYQYSSNVGMMDIVMALEMDTGKN